MRRLVATIGTIVMTLGCGGEPPEHGPGARAPPRTSAPPTPATAAVAVGTAERRATAVTVEFGAPARFAVPGDQRNPDVEVVVTEVVAGTAAGRKPDVRLTVRARRRDGVETGVVGGARREGAAEWEAIAQRVSPSWTGLVPDGDAINVGFERCDVGPGVAAGFAYVSAQVTPRVVDERRVRIDVRCDVVDCVR